MRYAELLFLALLVLYHVVLLVPRHRRLFAANHLVFLAGAVLAWNLAMEGLRWQTLPPLALFLVDLLILFPTLKTLRGTYPKPGWLSALIGSLRTLVATFGLLVAVLGALLAVAFPLPEVELTGGLAPGHRVVRFPPDGQRPGLELRIWYPASGDLKPLPRPQAEAEAWQRERSEGGLPVFWQSYLEHLPSNLVAGGRLATPKSTYPLVHVLVPEGERSTEFGYLWEDLASRGFVVAAGTALPPPLGPAPAFEWTSAFAELRRPLEDLNLWLQPESERAGKSDPSRLGWNQQALRQLANEPGDLLYQAIDWNKQALWLWNASGPVPADLGVKAVMGAGEAPPPVGPWTSLWVSDRAPASTETGRWVLTVPGLKRADLADAAYLKPYLSFWSLKSSPEARFHGAIRQYHAAFLQHALWGSDGPSFADVVPTIPGLVLTGR